MSEGLKTLKLLFKSLFVLANVLIVVLFVISAYSDRVSPDTILSFSYLGLVFPILCVLNLCFILYWLFLWDRIMFYPDLLGTGEKVFPLS